MRRLLGYPSAMSELRAHFPERDAYLDRLAQHYADGLLYDLDDNLIALEEG